ncbi:hypothetical protein Vretimale_17853, partial [Volvox reticuliferus]
RLVESRAAGATTSLATTDHYGDDVNEYLLWHGTSNQVVQLVVKDGFDLRESKRFCLLGEGIYFAANARYSVCYSKTGIMPMEAFPGNGGALILCRVALGTMALGLGGMRKPPPGSDSVYMKDTLNAARNGAPGKVPRQTQAKGAARKGAAAAAAVDADTRVDSIWDVGSALGDNLIVAVFDNSQAYPEYMVHFNLS